MSHDAVIASTALSIAAESKALICAAA